MSEKAPGLEKYTPSRLDWIIVMLNSFTPSVLLIRDGLELTYLPGDDGKSIDANIKYYIDLDEKGVDQLVNSVKSTAFFLAKKYKWDSWFDVNIILEPIERPSRKK